MVKNAPAGELNANGLLPYPSLSLLDEDLGIHGIGTNRADVPAGGLIVVRLNTLPAIRAPDRKRTLVR